MIMNGNALGRGLGSKLLPINVGCYKVPREKYIKVGIKY